MRISYFALNLYVGYKPKQVNLLDGSKIILSGRWSNIYYINKLLFILGLCGKCNE